jgi:S-formylglutathione hydrolase FrmB
MRADMTLYVPAGEGRDWPVVILLHGVYGSHWNWAMSGGAHVTARRLIEAGEIPPMVLAMPSDGLWGDGSGYVKHPRQDFERYVVDEVPDAVRVTLPGVTEHSPVFIAGLSMGGFGAMKLGAKYGHKFRGISGHSSVTHLSQLGQFLEESMELFGGVPEEDRSVLAWVRKGAAKLPPLRFDCGRDDFLIDENRELHASLEREGIPHVYEEFDGEHNWVYWERQLERTLRFFGGLARQG